MNRGMIIITETGHPITPADIDISNHLPNIFNDIATEVSAGWIIRFLQGRCRGWAPFTQEQICFFCAREHYYHFSFNRLVEPEMVPSCTGGPFATFADGSEPKGGGWIVLTDQGYCVTTDFVERCYKSSPVKQEASAGA